MLVQPVGGAMPVFAMHRTKDGRDHHVSTSLGIEQASPFVQRRLMAWFEFVNDPPAAATHDDLYAEISQRPDLVDQQSLTMWTYPNDDAEWEVRSVPRALKHWLTGDTCESATPALAREGPFAKMVLADIAGGAETARPLTRRYFGAVDGGNYEIHAVHVPITMSGTRPVYVISGFEPVFDETPILV